MFNITYNFIYNYITLYVSTNYKSKPLNGLAES